mmetsp:Transcript_87722/g.248531  ORF Transcript_87722/g.248531 Transcript_87722/m.248531 type:complete len:221 (+) Transcript_87722:70-732(+)
MPGRKHPRPLSALAALACACVTAHWLGLLARTAFVQHQPSTGARVTAPDLGARRRELVLLPAALVADGASAAGALEPCREGANNCFSTSASGKNQIPLWSWPKGMSRSDAVASLRTVVEAYPKKGQADVDLGGWSFAVDQLSDKGYARIEFMSGIGNFARFLNGGKPFVDDFELSIEEDRVCVRSSSRVGDSDFGVNAKRINYIAAGLRAQGWDAPGTAA